MPSKQETPIPHYQITQLTTNEDDVENNNMVNSRYVQQIRNIVIGEKKFMNTVKVCYGDAP